MIAFLIVSSQIFLKKVLVNNHKKDLPSLKQKFSETSTEVNLDAFS